MSEGGTVLSTVLALFTFQANQLIFGPGQAQVRRKCVKTVNQVSYLTSQCQWNVRILSVILCGASCLGRFPWLAYSKYLDGAFCLPCVFFFFGVQCGRNSNIGHSLHSHFIFIFLFFYFIIVNDTLMSSRHTLPVNNFNLEGGETMLARDNENYRAPGENRTRDPPNTRSDVLTTEPPV